MTKVQKLRFKRLIKMLENIKTELPKTCVPGNGPLKHFDMSTWACGTSACALGTAAMHPYFTRQGLHIDTEYMLPKYRRKDGTRAGAAFFGITYDESKALFRGQSLVLANGKWILGYGLTGVKAKQVANLAKKILAVNYSK